MIVDANVWISGLVREDSHHLVSRRWIEHQIGRQEPLVIPTIALAEIGGAISRRTGDALRAQQTVDQVMRSPGLSVVPVDLALGQTAGRTAIRYRLRGADAVYVAVAQALELPLVTWDRELTERARDFVSIVQPD